MSQAPSNPYTPYASVHEKPNGPGDARPTALQIIKDTNAAGTLKDKTILITGCSSGIGIETARALYETGAQLFMSARDTAKLDSVIADIVAQSSSKDAPKPEPLEMHLDSLDSVRKAVEDFKTRSHGRLNILINNAGVMACPYSTTKDGFESQMGTNHFAHFLLFQLLKPLLLKSATESGSVSRVINVSSTGHNMSPVLFDDMGFSEGKTYNKWKAYGQSKTANIYMASSIERHHGKQGIRGLSLHPGGIMTPLAKHMEEEDYKLIKVDEMQPYMKSPEQGAATSVWAAVSPHFEKENGGRYLADCGECGPYPKNPPPASGGYGPHVYDEESEEKLWKLSNTAVGLPAEEHFNRSSI